MNRNRQGVQLTGISREIWDIKYRYRLADGTIIDHTIEDTWRRVATAAAAVEEPARRQHWADAFYDILHGFRFLPGGRILAGAGTRRDVTLFNCFVMGDVEDSVAGIFDALKESALTMEAGGGIGVDFSTIRPRGAIIEKLDATAAGPVAFMDVWDAMCRTIMAAGARRGAMMGVLACDHPDIEEFITAKREPGRLTNFNMSVLITDAFMQAVENDAEWPLKHAGRVVKTVRARQLFDTIMHSTYDHAEPGVIFVDTINRANNLYWLEHIHATNPCGEQPLPPYGSCLLGSLNLVQFVQDPFSPNARLNEDALCAVVRHAVRLLDNVIDISRYPLARQRAEAHAKRRIGLGITGLADALVMLNLRYGSEQAAETARGWMACIERAAYETSIELAREKGPFPLFDAERYAACGHASHLPEELKRAIRTHGIRNALLTSIAPTGTISLLAGNVSSGIEPIFALEYMRRLRLPDGATHEELLQDHAVRLWREMFGNAPLPDTFVTVEDLHWRDHLRMQAALQQHVDSAISKTINLPEDISFEDFREVYRAAFKAGLKGCTTYRPNPVTGAVLETLPQADSADSSLHPAHTPASPAMTNNTGKPSMPETDLAADACDSMACTLPSPRPRPEPLAATCPHCGEPTLVHTEGCPRCLSCDYSTCG